MVTDLQKTTQPTSRYDVVAKLCEPDYKAERRFIRTELAFVKKKLAEGPRLEWIGLHKLGALRHQDWQDYHRALLHYDKQMDDYAEAVKDGVLPVKFDVYNDSKEPDKQIYVRVHVIHGKIDSKRQPPARPKRIDSNKGTSLALKWPKSGDFSRTNIKITPHVVSAEFSALGAHDAAVLINQLVHVHCGPDTDVVYEVHSNNVADETGDVEF
jgi:hypothetical protein